MKPQEAQWDLVVPTSIGLRLTPENRQPVVRSSRFMIQATSAESNVATVLAGLGMRAKVLTKFVAGSPLAAFIRSDLRARGLDVEGPEVAQGGPWGYRHQFNIVDSGFGTRGPRVWNDRSGEVGLTMEAHDFNLPRLFAKDGVRALHLSGLVAALSEQTAELCVDLAHTAKKHGSIVSFDLNYRASFWSGRERQLREVFREIARISDVLFGNEEDFQLALGIAGPEVGGRDLDADAFAEMIGHIATDYPRATYIVTTLRKVLNANQHHWGMMLWCRNAGTADTASAGLGTDSRDTSRNGGSFFEVTPREIEILDRIGGGDASIGGLLYGILSGYSPEQCLQFAWACGSLAVATPQDYLLVADEAQVWAAWEGNARVQR